MIFSSVCFERWLLLQPIGFGTGYILLQDVMKSFPEAAAEVSGLKLIAIAISCIFWAITQGHNVTDIFNMISTSNTALMG